MNEIVNVVCKSYDKRKFFNVTLEDGRYGSISQENMSIYPITKLRQVTSYIGKSLRATIIGENSRGLVLTRIPIMEARVQELVDEYYLPKKHIKVKIVSSSDSNLYADMGDGVSGIIYRNEIIAARFSYPEEVFPIGSEIEVKILNYTKEKNYFSLSHREVFSKDLRQYYHGMHIEGIIRAPIIRNSVITGYFVQITPAIAGILDVNNIRLSNGEIIPVVVKETTSKGLKLRLEIPN